MGTKNPTIGACLGLTLLALAGGALGCILSAEPLPAEAAPEPPFSPPLPPLPLPDEQAQVVAAPPPPVPGAPDDGTVEDFYEPLARHGTWVDVAPYGRVWQPADRYAGADFTPYASDGAWAVADDGGWVFESRYDQEWGWATYHYGRWVDHEAYGWVWVPGTVWAPSWVEWRYGGGYVGWVPMGPPGVAMVESRWMFVDQRRFVEPGVLGYRLGPDRAHMAWLAASPVVDVRGGAGWTVGPPYVRMRAEGVMIRSAHAVTPGRGTLRAQARASLAERSSAPVAATVRMRRGPGVARADAREQRQDVREQEAREPHQEKRAPPPKAAPPSKPPRPSKPAPAPRAPPKKKK